MPSNLIQGPELWFNFGFSLIEAEFLERPNRFIAVVKLPGTGEPVKAHVADPGRLKELLYPGVRVLVRDHGEDSGRKLRYSLDLVYTSSNRLVSVNTQLPNRMVGQFLEAGLLPGFEGYCLIKKEFIHGKSRVDFLLKNPVGKNCLLEVKSCTLVVDDDMGGLAMFPDAPSSRGTKHIEELKDALGEGYESRVLFVIQRSDASRFTPNFQTDPALAKALRSAILAGVQVNAYCFELTPAGCRYTHEVPLVFPETF